jgi:DNA-binding NtrC family response regulator
MPNGGSGRALAERLWNKKPELKIIIMSGYSAELVTNGHASQAGFTFLAKPFQLDVLATTVSSCLKEGTR